VRADRRRGQETAKRGEEQGLAIDDKGFDLSCLLRRDARARLRRGNDHHMWKCIQRLRLR